MMQSIIALSSFIFLAFGATANAQQSVLIAPTSGPNAIVGTQISQGASLTAIDSACDAKKMPELAQHILAPTTKLIIGLPCVEVLDAAAKTLFDAQSDALIITLGVQVADITSRDRRDGWPVYRLGPSANQEAVEIANYIKANWRDKSFALIEDGTLYGRQIAQNVRLLLEEDNLKPVFTDTYRPLLQRQAGLVRRIGKSGATHIFIGGDLYDGAIIGKDAQALNIPITLMGGSAFKAAAEDGVLVDGTIFVAPNDKAGFETLGRTAKAISDQLLDRATTQNQTIASTLQSSIFKTDIGGISFGADGENNLNWFSTYQIINGKAVEIQSGSNG